MTAPDVSPDPERERVRLGDLIPDVVDVLAKSTATRRTKERHDEEGNGR
jgi:hypothetical protein